MHEVQQRGTERIHVRRGADGVVVLEILRAGVAHRHRVGARAVVVVGGEGGDTEVAQLDLAVAVDQEVLRLDVAVHDPERMGGDQAAAVWRPTNTV